MEALRNAGPMVKQMRYLKTKVSIALPIVTGAVEDSLKEGRLGEWIRMHLNAAGIAYDLESQASGQADQEAPRAVSPSEDDLDDQADGEDGEVQGIASEARQVCKMCLCQRTRLQGTVLIRNDGMGDETHDLL